MSINRFRRVRSFVIVYLFHIIILLPIYSQQSTKGVITGRIFDNSTKQPLEYATVEVINNETRKTITGGITDAKGNFIIDNIPFGSYRIDIEFIGYEKISFDNIAISKSSRSVTIGQVYLNLFTHSLQSVVVSADKPLIENKIDKVVYNAANDITSQGGLAIDVLKKVPQVTVDIDGNVELQGNSNIRFLINGKPSSVFGNSVADALASIPASQIKSIEAITNPGAKYDSQGTGGIINIVLKDNNMEGFNGNINISAGTRLENGSANFNYRHNNFGVNAFFSGNAQLESQVPFTLKRTSTDTIEKQLTALSQNGSSNFHRNGYRTGLGFDWDISKKDNLTGSLGYDQFGNQSWGLTNQEQFVQDLFLIPISDIFTARNSVNHFKVSSLDWSLDYKKKFSREGQELDILYDASNGSPYSTYLQTQTIIGQPLPFSGSQSNNPGKDNEFSISADYSHPVNKNFLIETGLKTTVQNLKSIAEVLVFNPVSDFYSVDPLQSYNLKYNMSVYAGYLSTSFKLFNYLDIKSGIRYEYTNVKIDYPNTSIPSYGNLVPAITLSHNFDKTHSLKLAYSNRIERPEYRELNPFLNLSDPYNINTGNLTLRPEIGNNFELGYSASFEKGGNIYAALIERINTHDKKQITTFYPTYLIGDSSYTNVSITTPQNIGEEYNSGISISGSYPLTSRLNLRGNLMIMDRYQVTHLNTGNISTGVRTRLNMNVTYQLPRDLVLEFFGNYNSASKTLQGKSPQFFIYNFAFRKLFLDKRASLGFTTTNPFNRYVNQIITVNTGNSASNSVRKMPLRSFGISLTYKFGKLEFNPRKKEENENNNNQIPEEGSR
jgi:outer membrane receptor protein involved in Fe transport